MVGRRWSLAGYLYDDLHARLTLRVGTVPVPLTATSRYPDTTALSYDGSGNVHLKTTHTYRGGNTSQVATWSYERDYYGADDKLRVVQRLALGAYGPDLSLTYITAPSSGAWEEYWYDALGRRVLARERRFDLSTETYRRDVIDRFMWDGDQLLYELRQPGAAADNLDLVTYGGTSRFYGTVGYIHGRDLDRPLALHDSAGRVPIVDARGQYEGFLRPTGAGADCKTAAGAGCWTMSWASKRTGAGFQTWGGSYPDVPDEWRGGLIQNQTDRAGLAYKRNRYYDPSTGRFTQEDPIGLAGGLNLYGFANGDPVNFSDPFGLCKVDVRYKHLGPGYYHAYIVTSEPDNTRTVYRGGPSGDGPSSGAGTAGTGGATGQASGSNSNSANSSSPGSGEGGKGENNGPWGTIRGTTAPYRRGAPDWQEGSPPSQRVVDDDKSCDKYNQSFAGSLDAIEAEGIVYNPMTTNSNAVVRTLLSRAGIVAPTPIVWAPGWKSTLF